jgi:histidinol-phosphatase
LVVLVEEAGGRLTDLQGVTRIDGGAAVATNGRLHDDVMRALGTDQDERAARDGGTE